MSILIQAGHYSSHSKKLMQKMYERGLSKPEKSYTHKLSPQQVTDTIYKILSRTDLSVANIKLADSIMVDFLLSNLDAENWGWAHEKNLPALDYWQQLEPNVRFILVFDHPNQLLFKLDNANLTTDIIDSVISEWIDYHTKLLSILENHSDKAILIEGVCALDNTANLGEQMKAISNNLRLNSTWQTSNNDTGQISNNNVPSKQDNIVAEHIHNEILKKYPEIIKLFNTLLNKAAMKSSEPIYKKRSTELHSLIAALNHLEENDDKQYLVENQKLIQELEGVKQQYSQEVQSLKFKYKESINESNEALKQLHRAQEELERKFIESESIEYISEHNKLLSKKIEELNSANHEAEKKVIDSQVIVDQYKSTLDQMYKETKQLKSINKESGLSEKLKQENEVLLKQLHYTQEELEKYFSKSQSLNSADLATTTLHNKVSNQLSSKAQVYYGAADRVKNALPYRLGSKMVKAKKPKEIAALPLALAKEYRDFRKPENNQAALPDLEEYRDKMEADKVREHLSYQLGVMLLESSKSPKATLTLPLSIGKKLIKFRKELKKK